MILVIDVDGVCAELETEWLARYNKDYQDNMTPKDWSDWGIAKLVKPECGNKIYKYLDDPTLYDNVKPYEGALEGVRALRKMGHRVIFATSTPMTTSGRKYFWLHEHGFKPDIKDYMEVSDKSLILADYLLDDRYENCTGFLGRRSFLFTRPWNAKYDYQPRVSNWYDFVKIMARFAEEK